MTDFIISSPRTNYSGRMILLITSLLILVVLAVSITGVCDPDIYARETAGWRNQAIGQDYVNLMLIIPVLFVSAWFAYRRSWKSLLIWGGSLLYLVYTFTIYCFDIHFNRLFPLYCFGLGVSFYLFAYFMYLQWRKIYRASITSVFPGKVTGVYLLMIASFFSILWLSQIVPAVIRNIIPVTLIDAGLPTNPVHVIDLSLLLPAFFIIGVLILRKQLWGYVLAPVFLVFSVLMYITLAVLYVGSTREETFSLSVPIAVAAMAMISLVILAGYMRSLHLKKPAQAKLFDIRLPDHHYPPEFQKKGERGQ